MGDIEQVNLESTVPKEVELPHLNVHILYAPHSTGTHWQGFEEKLASADIYIPELYGWTEENLNLLRSVSSGEITPNEALPQLLHGEGDPMRGMKERQLQGLFNTHKPVTLIDVDENHPVVSYDNLLEVQGIVWKPKFTDTLDEVRRVVGEEARMIQERENAMLANLKPRVADVIAQHPELADKKDLTIFLTLGSNHTRVGHLLKDIEGVTASCSFGEDKRLAANAREVAQRRLMFGKEIDDTLAARVLLDDALRHGTLAYELEQASGDGLLVEEAIGVITSRFSRDEIEALFKRSMKMARKSPQHAPIFLNNLLVGDEEIGDKGLLSEKGIQLPKTNEEFEIFLRQNNTSK